jgi:hypothetical protein
MRVTSSGRAGIVRLAKLAEGPLDLGRQIHAGFAIPAQVRLVEGSAVERRRQIAAGNIPAVGLPPDQFFAQDGHPAAESAQKAPTKGWFLEHQPQHFLGLPHVLHVLFYDRDHCGFQRSQWIATLRCLGKSLRYPLAAVLHAEGEQFFFTAEIAEKRTPGDAGPAADLCYSGAVKADRGKQIPGSLLNLPQDKLMFPFAKRPGILGFRPFFAVGRRNRFLHCMQIMAQSAAL